MTAAQQTQQRNRDTGGRYQEHIRSENASFEPPDDTGKVMVRQWPDGTSSYLLAGELHRLDGPAEVTYRDDGGDPVRVENYWQFGKQHRLDGPAVSHFFESDIGDGPYDEPWEEGNEFWIDGEELTESKFEGRAAQFRATHPDGAATRP